MLYGIRCWVRSKDCFPEDSFRYMKSSSMDSLETYSKLPNQHKEEGIIRSSFKINGFPIRRILQARAKTKTS